MAQVFAFISTHAPALTPFAVLFCFAVLQLQFRAWRPAIVQHVGMTNAIAAKLAVTDDEERAQEKRADAELPHGMTAAQYLDALSTAAIDRDRALSELATLKGLYEKLTGAQPSVTVAAPGVTPPPLTPSA